MDGLKWVEITHERYMDMLEALPPALWKSKGFLLGEPTTHRECRMGGGFRAAYSAFIERDGRYFECCEALTKNEFLAVDPAKIGD